MSRPGITYEDVKSAALALRDRGEHPSIQRVREHLGTGSYSTIAGYLKRWRQEQAELSHPTPLPPAVPETLMDAVEVFWKTAVEQADDAYRQVRETARAEAAQALEQRDRALADRDQALADGESLRRTLVETRDQLRRLDRDLLLERERRARAEQAITEAEERAMRADQAMKEARTQAQTQVERLETARQQLREDTQRQAAEAEQRLNVERQRGEDAESRLLQIIDQLRTERNTERRSAAEQCRAMEEQALRGQQAMQRQAVELATARERCRALEADLDTLRNSLRETLDTGERRMTAQIRLIENLRGKLRTAATERNRLEATLAGLGADDQRNEN